MSKVFVVGGAGYIGSHMILKRLEEDYDVVILDNLSTGHRQSVVGGEFIEGSLSDKKLLDSLFTQHHFDAVMHFAGCTQVGESHQNPSKYYHNNVSHTLTLLDVMREHHVKNFIFSSTAAIFGESSGTLIAPYQLYAPLNPYGRSKMMIEMILKDFDQAYGLKSICLRYFNAAGADPLGRIGECHEPETHLIPVLLQVASGRRCSFSIFGQDYDTPDGTCIRDYVHVMDLCEAHLLAMNYLFQAGQSAQFNLGNGLGFSVLEVIQAVERVTGKVIERKWQERRPGDPERLVADASLAQKILGWKPTYPHLDDIILHAWNWEMKQVMRTRPKACVTIESL